MASASLQNSYFYLNAKFSPHSPPCADQLQDILQKKIETDSCVYLQLASKNVGCILMFLGMLVFRPLGLGIHHVSWISAAFPLLGLIGLCFVKESPLFDAR